MQRRALLAVGLAALLILPVATAYVPTEQRSPAMGEPTTQTATRTPSDGSSSANNYTRLYIEEGYRDSEVKPGESTTFNITVTNGEDHPVTLNPHVVLPKVRGRPIQTDWVTIADANTTLAGDARRTFTVTVSVPEGTELGEYHAQVAFTNQTVSYDEDRPPRPVHAATINVRVFKEPTVEVTSEEHYATQIQAGDSYTYRIQVRNSGAEPVPVNPTLRTEESRRHGEENTAQRDWFEINAPNEIAPGENETIYVTVRPPESAAVGDYDTSLDLGLKDPARPRDEDYWQRIDIGFRVWKQPEQPFETSFRVENGTENVTLTLSAERYGEMASEEPASFDVTFVGPDGETVDARRVQVSNTGSVSLMERGREGETQGPYTNEDGDKEFVYRVDEPAAGQWSVRIMPHNTADFRYEIVRDES